MINNIYSHSNIWILFHLNIIPLNQFFIASKTDIVFREEKTVGGILTSIKPDLYNWKTRLGRKTITSYYCTVNYRSFIVVLKSICSRRKIQNVIRNTNTFRIHIWRKLQLHFPIILSVDERGKSSSTCWFWDTPL